MVGSGPDGTQSLFANNLQLALAGNDIDPQGNLIQAGFLGDAIYRIDPAGTVTFLSSLDGPVGIVVDDAGTIYSTMCPATVADASLSYSSKRHPNS